MSSYEGHIVTVDVLWVSELTLALRSVVTVGACNSHTGRHQGGFCGERVSFGEMVNIWLYVCVWWRGVEM